jgi:hypothetical protein
MWNLLVGARKPEFPCNFTAVVSQSPPGLRWALKPRRRRLRSGECFSHPPHPLLPVAASSVSRPAEARSFPLRGRRTREKRVANRFSLCLDIPSHLLSTPDAASSGSESDRHPHRSQQHRVGKKSRSRMAHGVWHVREGKLGTRTGSRLVCNIRRSREMCGSHSLPKRSGPPKPWRRRVARTVRSSVRAKPKAEQVPQPSGVEAYGGPTRLWP